MRKWIPILLAIAIFVAVALFRILATTAVPYVSDDASYEQLRMIGLIQQAGGFVSYDPLSYFGRELAYNPFIPFIYSFFGDPLDAKSILQFKIILNLLASSVVLIIFWAV